MGDIVLNGYSRVGVAESFYRILASDGHENFLQQLQVQLGRNIPGERRLLP
jgi:hypothetical protein